MSKEEKTCLKGICDFPLGLGGSVYIDTDKKEKREKEQISVSGGKQRSSSGDSLLTRGPHWDRDNDCA